MNLFIVVVVAGIAVVVLVALVVVLVVAFFALGSSRWSFVNNSELAEGFEF